MRTIYPVVKKSTHYSNLNAENEKIKQISSLIEICFVFGHWLEYRPSVVHIVRRPSIAMHCKTFSDSEGSRLEEDFASTTLQTRPKVFYLLLLLFFVFLHFKFQYFIGESPWGRLQLNNSPNHTKGFSKQVSSSFGLR